MTKEEAIHAIEVYKDVVIGDDDSTICNAFRMAIEALKQEPRKHGQWNNVGHEIMCSECGCYNFEWEFCPHCGADMRGGR